MDNADLIAALWMGLALLASLVSIRVGISVALNGIVEVEDMKHEVLPVPSRLTGTPFHGVGKELEGFLHGPRMVAIPKEAPTRGVEVGIGDQPIELRYRIRRWCGRSCNRRRRGRGWGRTEPSSGKLGIERLGAGEQVVSRSRSAALTRGHRGGGPCWRRSDRSAPP